MTFDLAVLGGGPAGCAAALRAAQLGLSVALFEPQRSRTSKPCGEGIMPAGCAVLEQLGLGSALATGRPFERISWHVPGAAPLELALDSAGLALERRALQAELDRAVARTPRIERFGCAARAERVEGAFLVRATGEIAIGARTLVTATGLGGEACGAKRRGKRLARSGLRAHFLARAPLRGVEVHLSPEAEVYLTPLPRGLVNVAVLLPRSLGRGERSCVEIERALAAAPAARARLGEQVGRAEGRELGFAVPREIAERGALLAGDAGGGVDPILGCGLTVALRSGLAAAEAAFERSRGARPRAVDRRYRARYAAEVRARTMLAAALRTLAAHPRAARIALGAVRALPSLSARLALLAAGAQLARR